MKQKKHRPDEAEAVLRLVISLDVTAEALGAGDGYLYVSDGAKKKKKKAAGRDNGFTLSLRDAENGSCVCEITARREAAEWERLAQSDCFRYTDALAEDLIAKVRERPGLDLIPYIEEITVDSPLTAALRDGTEGPLRDKAARLFPERQTMRIEAVRNETGVTLYELRRADGYVAAPFRAGQTVRVFPDGKEGDDIAPAALCGSPALTKEGRYTAALPTDVDPLAGYAPGDTIVISAPEGAFYHTSLRDHRTVIGLTDARGLSSFLSMACAIRDHLNNFKLTVLLYGCKDGNGPLAAEWDAVCGVCGKVRLIRLPDKEGVSPEAIKEHLPHETYSVFICGAPDFCEQAQAAIAPLGLPLKSVRCEQR